MSGLPQNVSHSGVQTGGLAPADQETLGERLVPTVSRSLRRAQADHAEFAERVQQASKAAQGDETFFADTLAHQESARVAGRLEAERTRLAEIAAAQAADQRKRNQTPSNTPTPPSAPNHTSEPANAPQAGNGGGDNVWDRLAACESGGRWDINTGNGYYGGLQFSLSSWQWVGGSGYPHEATKAEQIKRAEILLSRGGWKHWPACSKKLGLR
jgi:hypothetical protein